MASDNQTGLAFAAWQQKHHDNAFNTAQAKIVAERREALKRRDTVYSLDQKSSIDLEQFPYLPGSRNKANTNYSSKRRYTKPKTYTNTSSTHYAYGFAAKGIPNNEDGSEHDRRKYNKQSSRQYSLESTQMRNSNYAD